MYVHGVFGFEFKIRLFIWWINLPVCIKLLSIINKGHIFMNFDGMILTLHMDLCGTLCTPGQVLEDSSL